MSADEQMIAGICRVQLLDLPQHLWKFGKLEKDFGKCAVTNHCKHGKPLSQRPDEAGHNNNAEA